LFPKYARARVGDIRIINRTFPWFVTAAVIDWLLRRAGIFTISARPGGMRSRYDDSRPDGPQYSGARPPPTTLIFDNNCHYMLF